MPVWIATTGHTSASFTCRPDSQDFFSSSVIFKPVLCPQENFTNVADSLKTKGYLHLMEGSGTTNKLCSKYLRKFKL